MGKMITLTFLFSHGDVGAGYGRGALGFPRGNGGAWYQRLHSAISRLRRQGLTIGARVRKGPTLERAGGGVEPGRCDHSRIGWELVWVERKARCLKQQTFEDFVV